VIVCIMKDLGLKVMDQRSFQKDSRGSNDERCMKNGL
jgi:hypothetical protein